MCTYVYKLHANKKIFINVILQILISTYFVRLVLKFSLFSNRPRSPCPPRSGSCYGRSCTTLRFWLPTLESPWNLISTRYGNSSSTCLGWDSSSGNHGQQLRPQCLESSLASHPSLFQMEHLPLGWRCLHTAFTCMWNKWRRRKWGCRLGRSTWTTDTLW